MFILAIINSHRENNLDLYMFLFLRLHHPNYSGWGSVHIRDMKYLNTKAELVLTKDGLCRKQITASPLYHLTMLTSNRMQKSKAQVALLV